MLAYRGALITRLGLISRPGRKLTGLSRDASGITLIEVLIASLVVGIAAIGLALMFAHGQAFIAGEGDNRVAVYLAQQKIERCRAQGFASPPTPATLAAAPVTTSQQLDPSQADSDPCYTATPTNTCISGTPVCYTRTTEIVLVCGNDYNTLTTAGCVTTPPPPPPAKRITVTVQAAPKEARQVALTAVLADR